MAAYIVRHLVPESSLRANLITFAPAADLKAAEAVSFDDQAERAEEFLQENGWSGSSRHFVGNLFLRTLLLDQLARRETALSGAQTHANLRDYYGVPGPGPLADLEAARLYHCLALGDRAHVVDRLCQAFAGKAEDWIDALRQIACAPCHAQPDESAGTDRRAVALGAEDANFADDEIRRSINRLLHAAWFLTDPLVAPDSRVIDQMAGELDFLARKHASGSRVLVATSRAWSAGLRFWDQQGCDQPMTRD